MFIKKEKYRLNCGKYRLWTLFNIPIVGYWYCENGTDKTKHWVFPLFRKMTFENRRVMYLKININDFYVFDCFQHWVDTAHKMNAIVVIVCDNETVYHTKFVYPNAKMDGNFSISIGDTPAVHAIPFPPLNFK